MTRVRGHEVGVEALRRVDGFSRARPRILDRLCLSTENWNRPKPK